MRNPYDILVDVGGHQIADDVLRQLAEEGWHLVLQGPCRNPDAGMDCGCQSITVLEEYRTRG